MSLQHIWDINELITNYVKLFKDVTMPKFDWNLRNALRGWDNLDSVSQEELLNKIEVVDGGLRLYTSSMADIMSKCDMPWRKRLFKAFVKHGTSRDFGRDVHVDKIIRLNLGHGIEEVKKILLSCKNERLHRMVLSLPDLTLREEVAGLRGLSFYSYCPVSLYTNNYSPTLSALKKIPTVKRLKVMETLLANKHIGYNIFKHISEDEIELLLFGSSLRHKERVAEVCSAYKYFSRLGDNSKVRIDYDCSVCGEYNIIMSSNKIHSIEDFNHVRNARCLIWNSCIFCKSKVNINFRNLSWKEN